MSERYISLLCESNSDTISGLQMGEEDFEDNFLENNNPSFFMKPYHFSGSIGIYYFDEDEVESELDDDEDGFGFDAEFDKFMDYDKSYRVGTINFNAYDLSAFGFSAYDKDSIENLETLDSLMWFESADATLYMGAMHRLLPKIINRISEDYENLMVVSADSEWLITLDRLYIDKKYRCKGIANYVTKNLYKIMKTSYHINAPYVCGVCKPDKEDGIDNEEMIKIQKKPFKMFKYMESYKGKDLKNTFCGCIHPDVE